MWILATNGHYYNLATATSLSVGDADGWRIFINGTGTTVVNAGPYASEADATDAMRRLVAGIDPSTLV